MDCLFIHGNYPAQFKHLAPLLAQAGHRVVFLTNRNDIDKLGDTKIEIRQYLLHRGANPQTHHYLTSTEEAILQGQAILRAIDELIKEGFQPKFVVTHGGLGLGLFIKDILPKSIHIGYFEWYFQPETTKHLIENFNLDSQLSSSLRNLPILHELEKCDIAVTPTKWQKQQFPRAYHSKIEVIFDGIDTKFFKPQAHDKQNRNYPITLQNRDTKEKFEISKDTRLISYATRGMEPLRGFPEFMRSLPRLFKRYDDLQVVVAGADRRAYSYDAPSHEGSWKNHLLAELKNQIPNDRLLFTGLLDYNDYRKLLWRTNLHCYFTKPYVTSWSLFEAAACGARLAVNKNQATEGIVEAKTANWVSLDNQFILSQQLEVLLAKPGIQSKLSPEFDLQTSLKQWEQLLNRALQKS